MKKCPSCAEEIKKEAKKCPKCQKDLRNWFVKHWIISVIGIFIILGIISSNGEKGNEMTEIKDNTNIEKGNENKEKKVKIKLSKALCKSVKNGDLKENVIKTLGEPKTISESDIQGIGLTEYFIYQIGGAFDMESCQVTLLNGKVSMVSYVKL